MLADVGDGMANGRDAVLPEQAEIRVEVLTCAKKKATHPHGFLACSQNRNRMILKLGKIPLPATVDNDS